MQKELKKTKNCPYHKLIHVDKSEQFRVNSTCESVDNMVSKSWFVLPPVMEWYYKSNNPNYQMLPAFRSDCVSNADDKVMDFIYPKANTKIILTKNFESKIQPAIFKIAHTNRETELFWYLDDTYLGSTKTFHEMPISAKTGFHIVTVVDELGNEIRRKVEFEQ